MITIIENQNFIGQAGKDSSALELNQYQRPILIKNCIIDSDLADWGLKAPKIFDLIVEDCIIKNGLERALDMVRGGNIIFRRCKFINDKKDSNGKKLRVRVKSKWNIGKFCDIGIKAGICDVHFQDCEFNDILLGDYSIYDQVNRPKTRRIEFINCKNPNGGPIFIRGRYVDKKSIIINNTNVSMLIWPNFITKLYWLYNRKFGDKRPLIGEQAIISEEEKT